MYLLGGGLAHCISCGKPMRSIRSPAGLKRQYYLCASWLRSEPRDALRQQVREDYDTDRKLIIGARPWGEFVPLFKQTNLVERDMMFVLKNKATSEDGGSSGQLAVSGGRDGGRTP